VEFSKTGGILSFGLLFFIFYLALSITLFVEVFSMSTKQDKAQLSEIKTRIKQANKKSDKRLLKLTLIMMLLAFIAAVMHGIVKLEIL